MYNTKITKELVGNVLSDFYNNCKRRGESNITMVGMAKKYKIPVHRLRRVLVEDNKVVKFIRTKDYCWGFWEWNCHVPLDDTLIDLVYTSLCNIKSMIKPQYDYRTLTDKEILKQGDILDDRVVHNAPIDYTDILSAIKMDVYVVKHHESPKAFIYKGHAKEYCDFLNNNISDLPFPVADIIKCEVLNSKYEPTNDALKDIALSKLTDAEIKLLGLSK